MAWAKSIKEAVILFLVAVAAALAMNHFSPAGLPLLQLPQQSSSGTAALAKTVEVGFVRDMLDRGKGVLVDARSRVQYRQGHIPGAVSLPAYNHDEAIFSFMETYAAETTVVTYCSGVHCSDSHVLAEELVAAGYENVLVFSGGVEVWKNSGGTLEDSH